MFVAKERPYNQNNSDFQYCLKVQYDSPLPQTRSQVSRRRHAEVDVADDAGAVVLAEEQGGNAVLQFLFAYGGLTAHVGIIANLSLLRRFALADKETRPLGRLDILKVRVVGSGVECTRNANTSNTAFVTAKRNIVDD